MNAEFSGFVKLFVKNSFVFALLTPSNCLQKYLLFCTFLKHWSLNLKLVGNVLDTKPLSCVAEERFGQMGVDFIFLFFCPSVVPQNTKFISFRGRKKSTHTKQVYYTIFFWLLFF